LHNSHLNGPAENAEASVFTEKEKKAGARFAFAAVGVGKEKKRRLYLFLKRLFDVIASFSGLIILFPLFIAVIAAIRLESEGKAIYRQTRLGKNGKPFTFYKFRSMANNSDELLLRFTPKQKADFEKNFKLDGDPRVTKFGAFLRRTSLDELPQLLNILFGELSVVGPRPIVECETYKYGEAVGKLLSVKPGLTGYWQVNGRNGTTYEQRVEMDMFYIDNRSLLLDAKIFFKTFKAVFTGKGAR
jgi:lipopolysaccharide/colanic/teichoic acid biosynthesis glycosyltransferase